MHLQKTGFLGTICETHLSMHCPETGTWKEARHLWFPCFSCHSCKLVCLSIVLGRKVPSFIQPLLDNKSFQSGLVIKVGVVSSMKFEQALSYSDVVSPTVYMFKADCLSCKVFFWRGGGGWRVSFFFKLLMLTPSTEAPLGAWFSWADVQFPPHSLSPDGCPFTFCKTSWARGRVTNHPGFPRIEGVPKMGDFQAKHEGWSL